ncbi:hypothetical protein ABZ917_46715 [Nonomuraea wenchangensis]
MALVLALSGCTKSGTEQKAAVPDEKKSFRLGETSPVQTSTMRKHSGATFTITPTEVKTGTKADIDNSGLKKAKEDGSQIPVYVRMTLTHKSGAPMEIGDMDNNVIVRTDKGHRARALILLLGKAQWPDCPAPDLEKMLKPGQSENMCNAFLIPEGHKAAAVEITQGYYKEPLEWQVDSDHAASSQSSAAPSAPQTVARNPSA